MKDPVWRSPRKILNEQVQLAFYGYPADYLEQFRTGIDKVTAADVQRVAKAYLVASNMTEGVLVPTGVLNHPTGGLSGGELR